MLFLPRPLKTKRELLQLLNPTLHNHLLLPGNRTKRWYLFGCSKNPDARELEKKFKPPFALSFVLEKFQPHLVELNEAITAAGTTNVKSATLLRKSAEILGAKVKSSAESSNATSEVSGGNAGSSGLTLGFVLSSIWPLFQDPGANSDAFDLSIGFAPPLSTAFKLHKEANGASRKVLRPQYDPCDALFDFVKKLSPELQKQLRREIRKRKGFEEGKVSVDAVKKIVRSQVSLVNADARADGGILYLCTNLKTRKEYVGTVRSGFAGTLVDAVRQLFKLGLLPKQNSINQSALLLTSATATNNMRELLHAIRISSRDDWRFVELVSKVTDESTLRELEKRHVIQFNTVWPNGYNV